MCKHLLCLQCRSGCVAIYSKRDTEREREVWGEVYWRFVDMLSSRFFPHKILLIVKLNINKQ